MRRYRLCIIAYSYRITYTPGEKLVLADAISRVNLQDQSLLTQILLSSLLMKSLYRNTSCQILGLHCWRRCEPFTSEAHNFRMVFVCKVV